MIRKIRKSISSLSLRAFSRNSASGGMNQGWLFEKREGTLTQFDPSMGDSFDVAAFYVEGQLDFPNQLPENILQLYHQLYDMEQKVKALENEISVYVMQRQEKSPPRRMERRNPAWRRASTVPPKCCIASLWNCAKPSATETYPPRVIPRQVGVKTVKKRHSVSTAVQTTEDDLSRGSRLSRVSWGSKVDVRYINKKAVQSEKSHIAPLYDRKVNEDMKNVVHLKIKIPKDILNLMNDDVQSPKRLENDWNLFNLIESAKHQSSKRDESEEVKSIESASPEKQQQCGSGNHSSCLSPCLKNRAEPTGVLTNNPVRVGESLENENAGNTIVGTSVVHNTGRESAHSEKLGIPVKQPGKSSCESQGCNCKGGTKNDHNLERLGKSFDMTESELSMLEKAVHNTAEPKELKIRTDYGSVNVVSHDPDCSCKICETFGSHNESPSRRSGRSESAAVISKKVIRVYYNGDYRNIVTHTEECGCEICSSIEEHSYRLKGRRASIISTNTTDLVVKNRGVCGCKNCKTVEMGPPMMEVGAMLSSSSFPQLDVCYYSNATIPSMQSFPRELTSTDEPPTPFTSPPSITSSDVSEDTYEPPPPLKVNKVNRSRPKESFIYAEDSCDTTPDRDMNKFREYKNCDNVYLESKPTRGTRKQNKRELVVPSSAKPSPAGLNKNGKGKGTESQPCSSCLNCNAQSSPKSAPTKSILSPQKTVSPSVPPERSPLISNDKTIQPNKDKDKTKDDKKLSSSDGGYTTLEALIQDLIRGQPGVQNDKVYTVTLGDVSNKPYTTIHIVDCSSQSNGAQNGTEAKLREPVKMPQGDKETSNVFFIKPLPSLSSNQTGSISDEEASSSKNDQGDGHIVVNTLEDKKMSNAGNGDAPQSDIRKAYKLTVSFGKKVVSFFKQREKKNSTSNVTLAKQEVSQDAGLKTVAVYEGAKEPMELLQIEVKPRYFTLESIQGRGGSGAQLPGPLFYLVGENRNMQVVTTVA